MNTTPNKTNQNTTASDAGPTFNVNSVYIKDVSFEAPHSPQIFASDWQPRVDFDLQMGHQIVGEDLYEVVLHVTVTVKVQDDKVAFLAEVKQAGIFAAQGFVEDTLNQVLATTCPNILLPYAREAVSNLVTRGGFPQFFLPPVNFEALYLKHVQEKEGGQAKSD